MKDHFVRLMWFDDKLATLYDQLASYHCMFILCSVLPSILKTCQPCEPSVYRFFFDVGRERNQKLWLTTGHAPTMPFHHVLIILRENTVMVWRKSYTVCVITWRACALKQVLNTYNWSELCGHVHKHSGHRDTLSLSSSMSLSRIGSMKCRIHKRPA